MTRLVCLALMTVAMMAPCARAQSGAVAQVIDVRGTLMMQHAGKGPWRVARIKTVGNTSDHFKTMPGSMAALEFLVGGKISLSPGTEVELVGPRNARDVTSGTSVNVSSGAIWAKMEPQSRPFQVQTPSCTIGIRGTEFTVDTANNKTQVSVLSGAVGVNSGKGFQTVAHPGDVVTAGHNRSIVTKRVPLKQLRQRLETKNPEFHSFVQHVHQMPVRYHGSGHGNHGGSANGRSGRSHSGQPNGRSGGSHSGQPNGRSGRSHSGQSNGRSGGSHSGQSNGRHGGEGYRHYGGNSNTHQGGNGGGNGKGNEHPHHRNG